MFTFIASIPDDEMRELILDVREKRKNSNQSFEKLTKAFWSFSSQKANSLIRGYKLDHGQFKDLVSRINYYLFEALRLPAIFKIPSKNIYMEFEKRFKQLVSKRIIGDVYEILPASVAQVKMSGPTIAKVRAVARFIRDYEAKYKKHPSIALIARSLKLSEASVSQYIEAHNLFNMRKVEDIVGKASGDGRELTDFIVSKDPLPEERVLNKEESKIWRRAIQDSMTKLKQEVTKLRGDAAIIFQENYEKIMYELIEHQGKNQKKIADKYKIPTGQARTISRLWQKFVDLLRKNRDLVQYVNAQQEIDRMIQKISNEIADHFFKQSNEDLINNIVVKISGRTINK